MGKQHHDLIGRAESSVDQEVSAFSNALPGDKELLALWREYLVVEEQLAALDNIDGQEAEAHQFWESKVAPLYHGLCRGDGLSFLGLAIKTACLLREMKRGPDYDADHPVSHLLRTTEELLAGLSFGIGESRRLFP